MIGFALLWLPLTDVVAIDVVVLGLFKDRAVLRIEGQQHLLAVGETSPEGVTLVSADADGARFRIGDELQSAPLGDHISLTYAPPQRDEQVTLTRTRQGMYLAPGQINGRSVDMMVDTGATFVSMNRHMARRLGLPYRTEGKPIRLSTANGDTTGYQLSLRSVRIGGIEIGDVEAVVNDGDFPEVTLLGMSFLGKLNIEHRRDGTLLLKQHR
ncbi:MAG: TIGR02281 family clan AA aspartic protease [Gammaproteobacteria bacterium]|nr:TIGR02281 family clan AA aspartic protease [Gammaproteobacteria bacterium]MCP5135293.1 TIGR02281 family clan AA aspartic protease [Gammaproteobacteria bacterium]